MLNNLRAFNRKHRLIEKGDKITCAVSGGADSMALLWSLYLLKEEWDLELAAAHFNHRLRGEESDRDEQFVREFCDGYGIPLYVGSGDVRPGKKGLEAAARDARYAFLRALPGKIATAHTADDNAETVLLHLVRGTGLKGLCGITPVGDGLIRPMLQVTRTEVEAFLQEYYLRYITDSSNQTDQFLRNRLRHHVMPLLKAENPQLAENLSAMALSLYREEALLDAMAQQAYTAHVPTLRSMDPALRGRCLERLLKECGVKEPERSHIALVESLVFSDRPSAKAKFPGGVTITRCYDVLTPEEKQDRIEPTCIAVPGVTEAGGFRVHCCQTDQIVNTRDTFTVLTQGQVTLRSRMPGDEMRLPGGTKTLKKLFIDEKIPAMQRDKIPVLVDEQGVLAVYGIGVNLNRVPPEGNAIQFLFVK